MLRHASGSVRLRCPSFATMLACSLHRRTIASVTASTFAVRATCVSRTCAHSLSSQRRSLSTRPMTVTERTRQPHTLLCAGDCGADDKANDGHVQPPVNHDDRTHDTAWLAERIVANAVARQLHLPSRFLWSLPECRPATAATASAAAVTAHDVIDADQSKPLTMCASACTGAAAAAEACTAAPTRTVACTSSSAPPPAAAAHAFLWPPAQTDGPRQSATSVTCRRAVLAAASPSRVTHTQRACARVQHDDGGSRSDADGGVSSSGGGGGGVLHSNALESHVLMLLAARARMLTRHARHAAVDDGGDVAVVAQERQRLAQRLVYYASDQADPTLHTAARLVGFAHVRILQTVVCASSPSTAACNGYAVSMDALQHAMVEDVACGRVPCVVVGVFGSALSGAVDPLVACAQLCRRVGAWLHLDASYGGSALSAVRSVVYVDDHNTKATRGPATTATARGNARTPMCVAAVTLACDSDRSDVVAAAQRIRQHRHDTNNNNNDSDTNRADDASCRGCSGDKGNDGSEDADRFAHYARALYEASCHANSLQLCVRHCSLPFSLQALQQQQQQQHWQQGQQECVPCSFSPSSSSLSDLVSDADVAADCGTSLLYVADTRTLAHARGLLSEANTMATNYVRASYTDVLGAQDHTTTTTTVGNNTSDGGDRHVSETAHTCSAYTLTPHSPRRGDVLRALAASLARDAADVARRVRVHQLRMLAVTRAVRADGRFDATLSASCFGAVLLRWRMRADESNTLLARRWASVVSRALAEGRATALATQAAQATVLSTTRQTLPSSTLAAAATTTTVAARDEDAALACAARELHARGLVVRVSVHVLQKRLWVCATCVHDDTKAPCRHDSSSNSIDDADKDDAIVTFVLMTLQRAAAAM